MTIVPTFSIIIATRNRAAPLRATLAAIARQSYSAFEAIIVDDGSNSDVRESYPRLQAALDPRFHFVRRWSDGALGSGAGVTRNHAMALARGKYLAFCDDDDTWCDNNHLAVAAAALSAVPDAALYFGNMATYRDGRQLNADWWPALGSVVARAPVVAPPDVRRLSRSDLLGVDCFGHVNIMIVRRSLVQEIGGFWEHVRFLEDLDFYLRVIDRSDHVLYRPAIVACHNAPLQDSNENESMRLDQLEKWLARLMVCEHVRCRAKSPEVRAFSRRAEGYALRKLALALGKDGWESAAFSAALQALVLKPGLKWAAYTAFVGLRSVVRR